DEQVGRSTRALRETEAKIAKGDDDLAALQARRDALQASLGERKAELASLLRAAYTIGDDAPLKLMLAQDRVADANRLLAYHRYLQRERARKIAALSAELDEVRQVETQIAATRRELDAARGRQAAQLAQVNRDRSERATLVAQLDRKVQDQRGREQKLGRDAKALERVLAQLRAAAARAERERREAAERAARAAEQARREGRPAPPPPKPYANATPIQVGGLGWPLSGSLIARFGGTLPDGRRSSGLLIAASAGTPVRAVADGRVVFAEWMSGYGLICIVDHGNGDMSLYAYNDALLRNVGDDVHRGDPVASVGNSGGQGRPALYFELRRNGNPVDPAAWLRAH
ncbi:MAG TPA: peptidoglycan DD-metalloendopeptidase family protein, partial [Lysobacter sp.]|nr:peptidoglycan DD-metalloendopeptidase family protein [Lysobacter sp.]